MIFATFQRGKRRALREWRLPVIGAALFAAVLAPHGLAQAAQDAQGAAVDPNTALGAPVTVHGVVMNAATGEPLPRVLVQVNGGSGEAVLTDGDGKFEVSGVPLGSGVFQLTKPGFEDAAGAQNGEVLRDLRGYTRDVFVTANTPALEFTMRPTNSIRGQIELSTDDAAQDIGVTLLQKQIQNGRTGWRLTGSTRTNADGTYHFAHLADGDYAVKAEPAPQVQLEGLPQFTDDAPKAEPGGSLQSSVDRDVPRNGYPEIYYPDARDFSGAARIHLAGGEQAQANLRMPLEAFHTVRATVQLPPGMKSGSGAMIQPEVVGPSGLHAPYTSQFDAESNTFWAMLPDGNYTIRVTAMMPDRPLRSGGEVVRVRSAMTGQADVTVAGHAVTKLRIPVSPTAGSPIAVMVSHRAGEGGSAANNNHGEVFVEISQAGPLTDGMQSMFAQGAPGGTLETVAPAPGKYWVHSVVAQQGLCEDSFTAGGANLGVEPLVVGPGGATAPLTLTLRDDCSSLKLSLPNSVAGMVAGQETAYTVYVVPDFDFTTDARSIMLRASTGGSFTFNSLTPGSYHVYTFTAPVDLEYHNRNVLAGLRGQAVTLAPGDTANLALEVPEQ